MDFDFVIPLGWGDQRCERFYPFLADELRNRGYKVAFLTESESNDRAVEAHNHPYFNIFDKIRTYKGENSISYDEEAARIEQT